MDFRGAKRGCSFAMSLLMVISSINFSLVANAANSSAGRIISFNQLDESISLQTLPIGASIDDVVFPVNINATVETVQEVEVKKLVENASEDVQQAETTDETGGTEDYVEDTSIQPMVEPTEDDQIVDEPVVADEAENEEEPAETEPTAETTEETTESPEETESVDTGLIDILFPAMIAHAEELNEDTAVAGVVAAAFETPEYETVVESQTIQSEITIENVGWQTVDGSQFDTTKEATYEFAPVFSTEYVVEAAVPTIKVNIVNADSKPAFEKSQVIDGVRVLVKADEGVFPEGATLSVEKVYGADLQAVESAVEEARDDNKNKVESYTFDIKVLDKDGNEIEPDNSKGQVKVSFTLEEVADVNLDTDVYHVKGEVGDLSVDKLEAEETSSTTVEAVTDGFSFYTVEFTYNDLQYVMNGDTRVALSDILTAVGLEGEVSAATSDAPELFSVAKENDAWYVTANQAFDTEQKLTVIIDGTEYVIAVTDEQTTYEEVGTFDALKAAITSGKNVKLTADIVMQEKIDIAGKTIFIDGDGHTLTGDVNNDGEGDVQAFELKRHQYTNVASKVLIKNTTFNLFKTVTEKGGAICNISGTLILENCNFTNNEYARPGTNGNSATLGGGAIYNEGTAKLYAINCKFINNTSLNQGGAIYGRYLYLSQCDFINNCSKSTSTGSEGGAVYLDNPSGVDGRCKIVNCKFQGNVRVLSDTIENDLNYFNTSPLDKDDRVIAGCGGRPIGIGNNSYVFDKGTVEFNYDDSLTNIEFNVDVTKTVYIDRIVYESLEDALPHWTSGTRLVLMKDITISNPIVVDEDKYIDLGNYYLGSGFGLIYEGTGGESAIKVVNNAKLTVSGYSTTTKYYVTDSGEVVIDPNGNKSFQGGYITGGKNAVKGGAIYVESGSVDMYNLCILGNSALTGGGIYLNGSAYLYNVTVTENKANNGGGIAATEGATVKVDQKVVVDSNNGSNGEDNIYLMSDAMILQGTLSSGTNIGINMAQPGYFTVATTKPNYYSSDNQALEIKADSEGLFLYAPLNDNTAINISRDNENLTSQIPYVGDTLEVKCDAGFITFQWYRDDEEIEGATGTEYTLTEEDVGKVIKVKATQFKDENGTDIDGEKPIIFSASTEPVEMPPVEVQDEVVDTGSINVSVIAENPNDSRQVFVSVEYGNKAIIKKTSVGYLNTVITANFDNLPVGNYNVICTTADGKYLETKLLTVEKDKTTGVSFKVLPGEIKTKVEVVGDAPAVAVDGLGDLLEESEKEAAANGAKSVEVTLKAEETDENQEGVEEIKGIMGSGQTLDTILDLSLTKIIKDLATSQETQIDLGKTNKTVLEIAIPYTVATGKLLSAIYRYHVAGPGQIQTSVFRNLASRILSGAFEDGTFFYDKLNNYIYMYASGFSTYAIATENEKSGGSSSDGSYPVLVKVYRLFNTNTGEHFYTANKEERDIILAEYASAGWTDEGVAWQTTPNSATPVYRLFDTKNGKHVYTTDANARDAYIASGCRDEGIAWYALPSVGRKVYKATNPKNGNILYTISKDEADVLRGFGYNCEEADFFVQ